MKTTLCYGDSLTWGFNPSRSQYGVVSRRAVAQMYLILANQLVIRIKLGSTLNFDKQKKSNKHLLKL